MATKTLSLFASAAAGKWVQLRQSISPEQFVAVLIKIRANAVAPVLQLAVWVCMAMSVMLLLEVTFMSAVSLAVKMLRRKPEKRYKWEAIGVGSSGGGDGDEENGRQLYPMVLVQIPMYNEREVYKASIGAACALTWPPDRIIVQVLDDSTDPVIKRRGWQLPNRCILCKADAETSVHLLLHCPFTMQLYDYFLAQLGLTPRLGSSMGLTDWWILIRSQASNFDSGLDSLIICLFWNVWLERNRRIFQNQSSSQLELRETIVRDLATWVHLSSSPQEASLIRTLAQHF